MTDHATDPLPATTETQQQQQQEQQQKQKQPRHDAPRVNLVICNIQKIANVKAMLLASVAFGCSEVLVVGQENNARRKDLFPPAFREAVDRGAIELRRFAKWRECVEYLKIQEITLLGVEIDDRSQLLNDEYFSRNFPSEQQHEHEHEQQQKPYNIGILMGNEGQGIQPAHLKNCDGLIRIPQYGAGTASMNVNVATNIVLYRFQKWKRQYQQQRHQHQQRAPPNRNLSA